MSENNNKLRVAISQTNSIVGDLEGNTTRLLHQIDQAIADGMEMFVTSELALTGYSIKDLIYRAQFHKDIDLQLQRFLAVKGITILLGLPLKSHFIDYKLGLVMENGTPYYNSVLHIRDGEILGQYNKAMLAQYSVFDEMRYFKCGEHKPYVFMQNNLKIGMLICEDVWRDNYTDQLNSVNLDLLYIANGSPYSIGKHQRRLEVTVALAKKLCCTLIYVNCVGYQDGIVFDGASFIINPQGELIYQAEAFAEDLAYIDLTKSNNICREVELKYDINDLYAVLSASDNLDLNNQQIKPYPDRIASIYKALTFALSDYVQINNFSGIVLGLSGGIDSALTLAICCDALGSDKVTAIMMPSQYTSSDSLQDSRQMAKDLGVKYQEIGIEAMVDSFNCSLEPLFKDLAQDITEENLQARIRGVLLMSLSNKFGLLVVSTGNKSELAVGYATLYGDMAGGFALLKDILKTQVYELAKWRNNLGAVIPQNIINRAPTAELRINQLDQDSLPEYDILDKIINYLVIDKLASRDIVAKGFNEEDVCLVARLLQQNEFKRQQGAVGPKISVCTLGMDWRYPIISRYKY